MSLGKRIKESRNIAGLSQSQLGEKMGTDSNTISRWERDTISPKVATVGKLAAALNVSVSYLMGESDEPEPFQARSTPATPMEDVSDPLTWKERLRRWTNGWVKDSETYARLGWRIKKLRILARLSESQLGEKIGTDTNIISLWERGTIYPGDEALAKLAAALNVSVSYLMGEVDDDPLEWNKLLNAINKASVSSAHVAAMALPASIEEYLDELTNNVSLILRLREELAESIRAAERKSSIPGDVVEENTMLRDNTSLAYWGQVADNAQIVAKRRDAKEISRVKAMIETALEALENTEMELNKSKQVQWSDAAGILNEPQLRPAAGGDVVGSS